MPPPRPPTRLLRRSLASFALWLGLAAGAQAQNAACQRHRAELSSLGDGVGVVRALQSEIGRLQAYHRALNCESGGFLFFDTRPPQCGAVEQRIRALNATYGGAASEDATARRRQLQAVIAADCADPNRAEAASGEPTARGGAQVICVRTCDGAFFPMRNLPDGRGGADAMCQALCPGAEAAAYAMPYGDDALKHAAAIKGGRAYAALATAFRFQKTFVPNCACKPADRTWAQSLAKAESMMVRHKGDIFVTPMQAEALSRPNPKVRLTLVGRADRTAAALAADAAGRSGLVPEAGAAKPAPAEAAGEPAATERAIRVIALDRLAPAKAPTP